jgi:hypothetical protein
MIGESEGKPGMPVENPSQIIQTGNGPAIKYELLTHPFHPAPVFDFLLPGTSSRSQLESAMTEYKTYLSGIIPEVALSRLDKVLDPSASLPVQGEEKSKISMMSGLHSLAVLKNALLAAENSALKNMLNTK